MMVGWGLTVDGSGNDSSNQHTSMIKKFLDPHLGALLNVQESLGFYGWLTKNTWDILGRFKLN